MAANVSERTATAMLYAIKSDTLFLSRHTHRADLEAFTYLYPLADAALVRKMEGADITMERLAFVSRAIESGLTRNQVFAAHLGAARYASSRAQPPDVGSALPYPANPNGSLRNLAGLCDPSGQVFGLMPHPEAFLHRFHHPRWRNASPAAGAVLDEAALGLFRNAVHHAASA